MDLSSLTTAQWIDIGISILVFVLTVILGRWVIKSIVLRLIKKLTHFTTSTLDDAVLDAVAVPAYWLAVIYVFQFSLGRLSFIFEKLQFDFDALYFVLYLLIGFAIALRLVNNISDWYALRLAKTDKVELSEQLMPFLRRIVNIIMVVIVAIMLLGYFEVDVSGFVATLGIGSLAIALAAQAALSDTISGFVIMIDRPYRIGDRRYLGRCGGYWPAQYTYPHAR